MSVSSASSATEVYNIGTVNNALNDLGMLSAITESRKEYLQECLKNSMEKENVDQAGPSTSRRESQKSSKSASCTTEKENTSIGGFQVLTMNSTIDHQLQAGLDCLAGSIKRPRQGVQGTFHRPPA
nr:uncharacterized protein LOC128701034 [Cherax quadricarinatus]